MIRMVAAIIVCLIFFLNPCPARTEGLAPIADCEVLTLRTSQGWRLSVKPDGSGAYGFGALIDRIEVKESAFDFTQIYGNAKKAAVEQRVNAEAPYVAVSCFAASKDSNREFYLLDKAPILDLFRTARMNSTKPKNEIEERWHKKIDGFWKRSPLFSGTPDTKIGK